MARRGRGRSRGYRRSPAVRKRGKFSTFKGSPKALQPSPDDNAQKELLIYYGWLNSFNSSVNSWNNVNVANDMSKYDLCVFGNGIADSGHGDYANAASIITKVKRLNTDVEIFGYIAGTAPFAAFSTQLADWKTINATGIFIDIMGYDYGVDRSEQNAMVDKVHAEGMNVFANAWTTAHVLGVSNDPSYPNSTWNPGTVAPQLTTGDWYLLESFPINTTSIPATPHMEAQTQWLNRGAAAIQARKDYDVNLAAISVISEHNANAQALFETSYVSGLIHALDAQGTSDTNYGSSSASVTYWTRLNIENCLWYRDEPEIYSSAYSGMVFRYANQALVMNFNKGVNAGYIQL